MVKQESKAYYYQIGCVWCPVLHDYVTFNKKGFRHLIRKRGMARSKKDQQQRLELIPYLKDIVGNAQIISDHRIKYMKSVTYVHGKRKIKSTRMNFWSLKSSRSGKNIMIIIQQTSGGNKFFLSAFEQ